MSNASESWKCSAIKKLAKRMRVEASFDTADQRRVAGDRQLRTLTDQLEQARKRGYLMLAELRMVASVKNGGEIGDRCIRRTEPWIARNTDKTVRQITTDPLALRFPTDGEFEEKVERKRMRMLRKLCGVSVPTASAILGWLYPAVWPVIDRRAWSTLHASGCVRHNAKGENLSAGDWIEYLRIVYKLCRLTGWSPTKVDRWLYDKNGS